LRKTFEFAAISDSPGHQFGYLWAEISTTPVRFPRRPNTAKTGPVARAAPTLLQMFTAESGTDHVRVWLTAGDFGGAATATGKWEYNGPQT
jgi:hypothetical protein